MWSPGMRTVALGSLAVILCFETIYASTPGKVSCNERAVAEGADLPAQSPPPTIDELVAACEGAKGQFTPRTEAHLQAARSELQAATARLDARLKAAGPTGEDWRAFLDCTALTEQLARDARMELETLDPLYKKYDSGHPGLNLNCFADVRRALWRYLTTARAIGDAKLKDQYELVLEKLPEHLEAYRKSPNADAAWVIGRTVGWLEDAGQAPELIRAIRSYFSHPNLILQVSAGVVDAGLGRPVDETEPVRDVILKADIFGTGHTTGRVTVELAPNAQHAALDAVLRGNIESRTTGYRGPARVFSDSVTEITSRKPLLVDAEHVWALPAKSRAVTRTKITGVRVVRGGKRLERLVWRRACSQKSQAEWVGARHAEQRVSRRVDQQTGQLVGEANQAFREKFRRPLADRNLFPELLRFHTTQDALHGTARYAGPAGLAASNPLPEIPEKHDLVLCLHESMINNLMDAALSGMILQEEELRSQMTEAFGPLPERLQPDEDEEPWAVTFAAYRPISVAFGNGRFKVTIRGRKYARGEEEYSGVTMNVSAEYEIRKTPDGFKAVRQGELEVFPPGFVQGEDKLSTRQQVLRTLLQKKFGKIFDEEWTPKPLVLPGRWEKAGELAMTEWSVSNGWILVAWSRGSAADQAAEKVAVATNRP